MIFLEVFLESGLPEEEAVATLRAYPYHDGDGDISAVLFFTDGSLYQQGRGRGGDGGHSSGN